MSKTSHSPETARRSMAAAITAVAIGSTALLASQHPQTREYLPRHVVEGSDAVFSNVVKLIVGDLPPMIRDGDRSQPIKFDIAPKNV